MEHKYIELFITEQTLDVTELFKGYRSLHVEISRGHLWFFKEQLQEDAAKPVKEGETYLLDGIVEIRNMGGGKSIPTLGGTLLP